MRRPVARYAILKAIGLGLMALTGAAWVVCLTVIGLNGFLLNYFLVPVTVFVIFAALALFVIADAITRRRASRPVTRTAI